MTIEQALRLLTEHVKDSRKVHAWMSTEQPFFGHSTPMQMIQAGKAARVVKHIKEMVKRSEV